MASDNQGVIEQFELPAMPAPVEVSRRPQRISLCTRANYKASVKERYGGKPRWCIQDALDNWFDFEEHRDQFIAWTEHYHLDPWFMVGDKCHNPRGTLSAMVDLMQVAIQPDRSYLHPCLDFNEDSQTVFIRRGLLCYLTLLLKEIEK